MSLERALERPLYLSPEMLLGMVYMHRYRFLTIQQFARITRLSVPHTREVLRRLHYRRALSFIGNFTIPGVCRVPKVYYLRRRGFELVASESGIAPEEIGPFHDQHNELVWTPQMYHRLALVDALISLECAMWVLPHLNLIKTFIEYRRTPGTKLRETADYVCEPACSQNRIVPDGAFVLENRKTARRGLFFLEADMGTERIVQPRESQERATIFRKFVQYDKYLTSGRFADTYKEYGDFRFATVLLVTDAATRVENIRKASQRLPQELHRYYRLTTHEQVLRDFLGPVWNSRDPQDPTMHALIARP